MSSVQQIVETSLRLLEGDRIWSLDTKSLRTIVLDVEYVTADHFQVKQRDIVERPRLSMVKRLPLQM